MTNSSELPNGPILYEFLEYFIRKQEPELIKCKNDAVILPTTGTIKNALKYLNNRYSLPESISQQVGLTLPWKFAIADNGRLLALLQENVIEIRKAKDEYSSIVGKASAPKDAFPQWRKLLWSPDGTILVLASSNGYTSFYNALGNNIFNITPKNISQNPNILEAGDAIASMIFLKPRSKNDTWSYEFLLVTYSGLMKSYHISVGNGFEANYEFSFGSFYRNGVNAVTYDEEHHLFYVAGNAFTRKQTSTASENGLTSWRPLNDYPYCKLSFTFDAETTSNARFSIWNIVPGLASKSESIIFQIRICPESKHLACLHTDGSISLWRLPNLILQKKWKLLEQPDFDVPNPLSCPKAKKFRSGITEFQPLDIGWWSSQAIIIARYSGSTSVCSIQNLKNLLGSSPEFLAGQPEICELGPDRGFLCLDCETYVTSKKRTRESSIDSQISELSSESEKEEDELEPVTILNYTTDIIQSTLYSITDIERFQPKRKKSKVLFRTYRILGLKSTTPEELYSRKIDNKEYEEALSLANTYNLDTDLVYQTQWRKSELSLNAIHEHLSKVTKRSWVLHECVTRVPDTIEATRELLNFGLKGANLETLVAIGVCDDGKFIVENLNDDWEDIDEGSVSLRQVQKVNRLLEKIDVKKLSDAQKDLIKYRRKLLDHLDKLLTYEIILEPSTKYDKNFYEDFRQLSPVENAVRFAKEGDWRSVEIMFTYYGESLLPHWLAVISFFPETLNPINYEKLLPECDVDGQLFLPDQRELRQKDWSEKAEFNDIVNGDSNEKWEELYEIDPSLNAYRNTELSLELLRQWYKSRAYEIEKDSYMVDNALQLIEIAKSHNITGLEELLLDLEALDDLVYKIGIEDLTLNQLEKLTNVEKIKLLMSTSTEETFVDNIKEFLLPFIKGRYQYLGGELPKHLFSEYLIYLSKEDLKLPMKLFEHLRQTQDPEILLLIDDIAALALDCVYACNDLDIYHKAKCILDSISKDRSGKRSSGTNSLLEELERELNCLKIFNEYGVRITLSYLRKNKSDPEVAKLLLIQMARSSHKIIPPPDENFWSHLLSEMLELQGMMFTCVDIEICFEIYVSARLMSGTKSNIRNCESLIETKKNAQSLLKISYDKAVNLILTASKEYFNSSKSLMDPNMELAKACLQLITDENRKIKEEYELIYALQILNEFKIDILPLQVRLMQDRLQLIEDCLNKRDDVYKSRQRLLTLANYLQVEGNKTKVREGKVLELIAKKALEVKDYNVCAATCLQLIKNSYIPAWSIALNLGHCNEYEDLKIRRKCLWFAISNGPSDILASALQQVQLIEIQQIHKNLELWMPKESFENLADDDDEDEFTDALTTPQVESKEFVPKVFEASTDIVKSSAAMVKESTFGLIRNISSPSFWTSRLGFNLTNTSTGDEYYRNSDESKEKTDLQGFPCFYESLHSECKLSDLDTKYVNYSMPDISNIKLKCCWALLRINLLSESACYGAAVSNINHLLLECAKFTLKEDWLLGLTYLLSLNEDCTEEVTNMFKDLPQTDLVIQTAAYYYSLKLHKQIYPDFKDIYLYDPLDLIKKMIRIMPSTEDNSVKKALKYWQTILIGEDGIKNVSSSNDCQENHSSSSNSFNVQEKNAEECSFENSDYNYDSNATSMVNISEISESSEAKTNLSNENDNNLPASTGFIFNARRPLCNDNHNILLSSDYENLTVETRSKAVNEALGKISSLEDIHQIRDVLLRSADTLNLDYITIDNHPLLKLIGIVHEHIPVNTSDYDRELFREYKELIKGVPLSLLRQYISEMRETIPIKRSVCLRLSSEDPELHEEAVNIIKENQTSLNLSAAFFEELFLKDLTACFEPQSNVYERIIEHVFVNRGISNTKKQAVTLAKELKRKKHISQALYIVSQIEEIPPSLCTFDTCYELLKRL